MQHRDPDQEARSILIDHCGSQLRHWETVLVALVIGVFAIVQAEMAYRQVAHMQSAIRFLQ